MTGVDEILDDLFHSSAFAAFVEQACLSGHWPCPESTRQLAYRLYEDGLARKNGRVTDDTCSVSPDERRA